MEIIQPTNANAFVSGAEGDLMDKLKHEKKIASEFQERKHADWNESYELYRNKVRTNRLTQRQAVNIPLMKETVKTLLSKIDEPPTVDWKELSGDEEKEIYFQEIWNDQFKGNKLEWVDVLDKKNVLLYGIGPKMLNTSKNGVDIIALDPFDVIFDPLMNPLDIESARFILRRNIFRSLREILADKRYTAKGKEDLKIHLFSDTGMVQSSKNREQWMDKMERLKAMGVNSKDFSLFSGGEVVVNLTEHFTLVWDTSKKAFEKRVVTYANDMIPLLDESLMDLIGVDFWPITIWSEDVETNDVYPDGVADLVRTPNKVLNVWFSQLIESRTLRNFQMHWYDATVEGYQPQTYEPGPGRMLPAPGDPNKTIMPVEISGLDETLGAIEYVTQIVERGTGATAIEKGVGENRQETLGEVKILVGKAMERTIGMAKFYRLGWYETAKKWGALLEANPPKQFKLYKTGRSGKVYPKTIYPSDWQSEAGYEPIVRSSSEQEEEQMKGIQKFQYLLTQFPSNMALRRIAQKRELEIVDLTPEELKEVEEEEKRNAKMMEAKMMMESTPQPSPENELMGQVQGQLNEFQNLNANPQAG